MHFASVVASLESADPESVPEHSPQHTHSPGESSEQSPPAWQARHHLTFYTLSLPILRGPAPHFYEVCMLMITKKYFLLKGGRVKLCKHISRDGGCNPGYKTKHPNPHAEAACEERGAG